MMHLNHCNFIKILLFIATVLNFYFIETSTGYALPSYYRSIWTRQLKIGNVSELGLDLHNFMRDDRDTPPLQRNQELEAAAQAYAESLVNSEDFNGVILEPKIIPTTYSQNVFNISDKWLADRPGFATLWAVTTWYDDYMEYNETDPQPSQFTRLIWKSSTDFGIGLATKGNNTVVVANYSPSSEEIRTAENIKIFQENVLPERPPLSDEDEFAKVSL